MRAPQVAECGMELQAAMKVTDMVFCATVPYWYTNTDDPLSPLRYGRLSYLAVLDLINDRSFRNSISQVKLILGSGRNLEGYS